MSELAIKLGWPISKLSKIEKGSQEITIKDLKQICDVLDENINDLIGEKRIMGATVESDIGDLSKTFTEFITNWFVPCPVDRQDKSIS